MKMILAIIQDKDYDAVTHGLTGSGFRVTCIASTGGFFRKGNSTLLAGVEDEDVDRAIELVRTCCSEPSDPTLRKATIFVLNVKEYAHF